RKGVEAAGCTRSCRWSNAAVMPDSTKSAPNQTSTEAAAKVPNVSGGASRARATYTASVSAFEKRLPTVATVAPRATVRLRLAGGDCSVIAAVVRQRSLKV